MRGGALHKQNKTRIRGFSLIETVIVVAVATALTVVTYASLSSHRNRNDLKNTTFQVAATLREAASRSASRSSSTSWGVHFENSTSTSPFYALFAETYSTTTRIGYYRLPPTVAYAT